MIALTRLNGQRFVINAEKIRYLEQTPDTMVCCESGERLMVKESLDEVMDRLREVDRISKALEEKKRQMSQAETRLARAEALRREIEDAGFDAAPDVAGVEIRGLPLPGPAPGAVRSRVGPQLPPGRPFQKIRLKIRRPVA